MYICHEICIKLNLTMKKTLIGKIFASLMFAASATISNAQGTDVTKTYIQNPDFSARFAGWRNTNMLYQTNKNFTLQSGEVYMEKWVSKGSKVGSGYGIFQDLRNMKPGTYVLTASAHNIQQDKSDIQTGAFLYANDEQVEVNATNDYNVTFCVIDGKATIGFKTVNASGNWVCCDNFRLTYLGEEADAMKTELQKLITEAEGVKGEGAKATELAAAIEAAQALLGSADGNAVKEAAIALKRATLDYRVSNASGSVPTVTTNTFVPTGNTIALGRSNVTGTVKEKGFCYSTSPNPTVLDECATETFSNNGTIYVMRGLKPSTFYYVRAYAMTKDYAVGYGDVVKIATLPAGSMTWSYDNAGDEQQNFRIKSATDECVWMYNNLSHIPGFFLQVHYAYGAGAGDGTAECSYGGWMNVSQKEAYQQTGTMLHETNHGVGVGTTGEWYNNSNLREGTSRGLWLGPQATKMVRFFENSTTATMTGDGTHMWPYGINGAQEDKYNPENTCLYYANILITHAMHQDGLPCTSGVGFASPAYLFEQDDATIYYIKNNNPATGMNTGYLTMTSTGTMKWEAASADDVKQDPNFQWHITYQPVYRSYFLYNVGTGRYITYSSGFKGVKRTGNPQTDDRLMFLPERIDTKLSGNGKTITKTAYWILHNDKYNSPALTAKNTTTSNIGATTVDLKNSATSQQWMFITENELDDIEQILVKSSTDELAALIAKAKEVAAVNHRANEGMQLSEVDEAINSTIGNIEAEMPSYTSAAQASAAKEEIINAVIEFIGSATPTNASYPFDISFLLNNPKLDENNQGWSESPTWSEKCCEYFQKSFDFNQTTTQKLPVATYGVAVQAFQRTGAKADTYVPFTQDPEAGINATVYGKAKTAKIKNIWADAQSKSLGGTCYNQSGKYIPDNMLAASKFFDAGLYENLVLVPTTTSATFKLGIKGTNTGTGYWTIFRNFRLYCYGSMTPEDVTAIETVEATTGAALPTSGIIYDLQGRRVQNPQNGIYIIDGKKIMIRK